MRVLIFGATGLLGKALMKAWEGDQIQGLGSQDADIRDEAQVRAAVAQFKPDWIVLAAAYTDVDGCESNQEVGLRREQPRGGQCGASRQRKCSAAFVFEYGLCFRWHEDVSV